ncbi:MAG TPA: hypothetical protein VHT25_10935 [Solirubrobacteraceae bacterium]|jgi:hypothetical protein|nr:hypothetical protein [Solirubrobacteraceae bacterium]
MKRAQLLRQLVLDSQYVIDEHLVATAILARAAARRVLADAGFRNDQRPTRAVRSFRPSTHVRSFRPYVLRAALDRRRAPGFAEPV